MSIFDTLVTDRTKSDALERNEKGIYRAEDMNRVGQAVKELAELFQSRGYSVSVHPKANWTDEADPTIPELQSYLADVAVLRRLLPMLPTTPPIPSDMKGFTWQEANDIEKILVDLNEALILMAQSFLRCGNATTYCGARGLPTE